MKLEVGLRGLIWNDEDKTVAAKSAGMQTLVLIPTDVGVVELGPVRSVSESLELMQSARSSFSSFSPLLAAKHAAAALVMGANKKDGNGPCSNLSIAERPDVVPKIFGQDLNPANPQYREKLAIRKPQDDKQWDVYSNGNRIPFPNPRNGLHGATWTTFGHGKPGMVALPSFNAVRSTADKPRQKPKTETQKSAKQRQRAAAESVDVSAADSGGNVVVGFGKKKKEPVWQCIQNCGACCKLNKGPTFASPEEIFDDPSDVQQYKSLIGPDGWCIHYEKTTRKCSIYADRPYFCRVEPDIFETLYGIDKKKFNREACGCCTDTIKAIYGSKSEELNNFKSAVWGTSS